MKKLTIIFLALGAGTQLLAESAAESVKKFLTMEQSHKADWFGFMKDQAAAKADLLTKQMGDWIEFKIRELDTFEKTTDFSSEAKEAMLRKKLDAAITLHEKHIAAWKTFAQDRFNEGKRLNASHEEQLAKFKAGLSA